MLLVLRPSSAAHHENHRENTTAEGLPGAYSCYELCALILSLWIVADRCGRQRYCRRPEEEDPGGPGPCSREPEVDLFRCVLTGLSARTRFHLATGKVLPDSKTVESCEIKEKDFLVLMVSKVCLLVVSVIAWWNPHHSFCINSPNPHPPLPLLRPVQLPQQVPRHQ